MAAADPIRNKKQLRQMLDYCLSRGQVRDYALIVLGVHTALRISDLLCLRWSDVYNFELGVFRTHLAVTEKKTRKRKMIALNKHALQALRLYFPQRRGSYIFQSNRHTAAAISRTQAYRIIRAAARAAGITEQISCHSLRKTFGYHAWKSGVSAVLLMDIYNHSNYNVTRRYLGVTQDDLDLAYLEINFM